MSHSLAGIDEAEIDRLRRDRHIGRGWAASAFARLAGRTILTRVPWFTAPTVSQAGRWETGILSEIWVGSRGWWPR